MAKIAPTVILPNLTSDGINLTFPISDVPGLTAVEADPVTGNGAEVLRLICDVAYERISSLDDAAKPTQMTYNKPAPQGISATVSRQSYNFGFNCGIDATAVNIAPES